MTSPRHLSKLGSCLLFAATILNASAATNGKTTPGSLAAPQPLTLEQAIELTLIHSPALHSSQAAENAAIWREHQAALLPNPELEAEIEDIDPNGKGLDTSVYTVRLGQTFELGGKRHVRKRLAFLDREIASCDLASAKADLVAETKKRFISLLAAQKRQQSLQAAYAVALKVRNTVAEKVNSGKVSPLALTKADVELAGHHLKQQRASRALASARVSLGTLWDTPPENCGGIIADGNLADLPSLPPAEVLRQHLINNPDWIRTQKSIALAETTIKHEKAQKTADVTLSVGFSHERESSEERAEFSVSLPLPLFNRNQGNINAAQAEADMTRATARSKQLELGAEFETIWQQTQAALEEAILIRDTMLPGAQKAFNSAEIAYRTGKSAYLDLLDAQQTLFETDLQYIETLKAVHANMIALERMIDNSYSNQKDQD